MKIWNTLDTGCLTSSSKKNKDTTPLLHWTELTLWFNLAFKMDQWLDVEKTQTNCLLNERASSSGNFI
jgi:hypothetical protein